MDDRYRSLRKKLMELLDTKGEAGDAEIRDMISELVLESSRRQYMDIEEKTKLSRELFYSVRRLDILQDLIDDREVTEIMVNGPDRIYVEKNGRLFLWNRSFASAEKLEDVVQQIVGKCNRVVNERMPIVDARLKDGSRVNVVISPIAL